MPIDLLTTDWVMDYGVYVSGMNDADAIASCNITRLEGIFLKTIYLKGM